MRHMSFTCDVVLLSLADRLRGVESRAIRAIVSSELYRNIEWQNSLESGELVG